MSASSDEPDPEQVNENRALDPALPGAAFNRLGRQPSTLYETGEEDLLWLASFNPVRYEHPGIFQAGHGYVQIESGRRGDFLARLEVAMGADQPRTLKTHYSRYDEYEALVRAVYLAHCREATQQAEQERLFTVFRLRVVNADDPTACERYRYPVRRGIQSGGGSREPEPEW